MSQIRRIKLPALYNLRDLGGYAGAEGKSTCWNKLYRCDCPAELTADQWEVMKGLGIKTLVDIRSTYEANELPVKAPDYMTYIQRPFFYEEPGADLTGEAGKKFLESLSIDYCVMTESSLKSVAAILNAILENITKGSVAFFCTAGKDRTGIIAAEILRLCGVCDDERVHTVLQKEEGKYGYRRVLIDSSFAVCGHRAGYAGGCAGLFPRHIFRYVYY